MSRRVFWIILIFVDTVLFGLLFLTGISGKDYSVNQKEDSYLIGVSYMTMNNEFYKIMGEEISARVEAEGDRMILRDPALDSGRQIEQIGEMLDEGIDALIITPADWESLTSVLEKAAGQGVYIVVADTNVSDEEFVNCTVTTDNYQAGVIMGKYFLTQCKKARVVIMTHEATKSGQDRVRGFLDVVEGQEGIEIVKMIECEGQPEIAMPRLQEAISEGLEFDNVFCLNDPAAVGAVAALEENQMLDQTDVYGVDASPDAKALIHEGMMKATVAQFPSELGKTVVDTVYRLLAGEDVEKNILIPAELIITKENVEQYGIDRWQ